MINVAYLLH